MASVFWWSSLAVLGLGVGVVAGMFGVGGGFLLTPLLSVLFRLPLPVAVGTGLCQMIGVATAALVRHQKLGQGEIKMDWMMLAGSLLGVGLGAQAVQVLEQGGVVSVAGHAVPAAKLWLSLGYLTLLGGVAAWMRQDAGRASASDTARLAPLTSLSLPGATRLPRTNVVVSAPAIGYLGLSMGFLSGLLGIGGGVALMPILLYGIGMPIRNAAGTGILVLLATCLAGTALHARLGHVRLDMALVLLVGSSLGAQIGAQLTARMDSRRLRGLFVYIIYLTMLTVAWNLLRTL